MVLLFLQNSSYSIYISLTNLDTSQSNIAFIFSFSIFILFSPIIISKKSISLTFYLHFSKFIYKLFSFILLNISFTNSSWFFSLSVSTITLLIKLFIFSVLIKFLSSLFTIVWNMAGEFVKLKNITIGPNNSSSIVKTTFYLSFSFILILLYLYLKFNFMNTFLVPIFSMMSEISDNGYLFFTVYSLKSCTILFYLFLNELPYFFSFLFGQEIKFPFSWCKPFFQLYHMVSHLLCWHPFTCFLSKDFDSLIESF